MKTMSAYDNNTPIFTATDFAEMKQCPTCQKRFEYNKNHCDKCGTDLR